LRAQVATPQARATDWLAFGQVLLPAAGRNRDQQCEALAALVQACQLEPACEPTLLHTIAQTGFMVRDWKRWRSAASGLKGHTARAGPTDEKKRRSSITESGAFCVL
jgi:hypothetical protein